MDALLFKLSSADGPPEWKVCADDWIDFYTDKKRGWILLAREAAVLAEPIDDRPAIEQVRAAEEQRWSPSSIRRRRRRVRRRFGSTGE
jgi:hypothetical protein